MEDHPVELPLRTDLTSRRERVAARVMVRGLALFERLTSRILVDVPSPADEPFYRVPENLEAFNPGDLLDGPSGGGTNAASPAQGRRVAVEVPVH